MEINPNPVIDTASYTALINHNVSWSIYFEETTDEMYRSSVYAAHYRSLFTSMISFAASLALALVLWQGGKITLEGVMELGTLSVFMSYALGMMEPVQWVVRAISNLIIVQVNIERFTKLMECYLEHRGEW